MADQDAQAQINHAVPTPPPPPLFTLDLGANGGVLAPTSIEEAVGWIQAEISFWDWVNGHRHRNGGQDQGLRSAYSSLHQALNTLQQAEGFRSSNFGHFQALVVQAQNHLQAALLSTNLPHSATPLAKQIAAYRTAHGDHAANYFASVFVPPQGEHTFRPEGLDGWRGFLEGLNARFGAMTESHLDPSAQATHLALDELRAKAEALLGEKKQVYEALHRDYRSLTEAVGLRKDEQSDAFDEAQTARDDEFNELKRRHQAEMAALQAKFNTEMTLRAPVAYWEKKGEKHKQNMWIAGVLSVLALIATPAALAFWIHDVLKDTPVDKAPASWRLAILALVGLFAVWAVRLLVRIYLSQVHLATDAAERVVMVKTYLALLEGDKLPEQEDRQMILQALFRPATDGIVKDEGIPPGALEVLTRNGKG
ncbi:DUF6161 domain-containing protein [Sphaerotilus mobilis]|uniref:DUF6161 domain-containing protein n=1 Tax=Sphaerotilus mobilis TaxID=47994 RepID=A0A4Q7LTD4_9BURK|nr:DUF6161 domain-containing protein [Sphaerotilus mobilis]RZS57944.1 hypothetical protein EV685_0218 [Sphaerotilus mobilis]